ncbi:AAA family ATPase [Legionella sp. CNM-4043-24]|uniref:AAA family ATPase n=1 Tax=Legionella sp. CNM-4043-24 TaxID=3421646 RepID=UPI00403AEDBA
MNASKFKNLYHLMGFTYEQNIIDHSLTSDITGVIDDDAFWEGKEQCWVDYDVTKVQVKKTIIVSAWYFAEMSEKLKAKFVFVLEQLIEAGHDVYVSQNDGLKKVKDRTLLDRELADFQPIESKDAVSQAAAQGLSVDSLDIINTKRLLELTDYFAAPGDRPDSNAYLPMSRESFQSLNIPLDPDDRAFIHFRRETEPAKPDPLVGELIINSDVQDQDLDRIIAQYPSLERLVINSSNINAIQLARLLNHYRNLSSLSLYACTNLYQYDLPVLEPGALASLKTLSIERCDISPFTLNRLLTQTPLLSGFRFKDSWHNFKTELLLGPGQIEKGTLYISFTPDFSKLVFTVLNEKDEKKELYFSMADYPGSMDTVQRVLTGGLDETAIASIFDDFLKQNPGFQFDIAKAKNQLLGYQAAYNLGANGLSHLRHLSFEDYNFTPEITENLLAACPDLETLTFRYLLEGWMTEAMLPLPQVKEVNVSGLPRISTLARLFSKCPSLTRLGIENTRFLIDAGSDWIDRETLERFKKITSLTLDKTSTSALFELLNLSPDLEYLELRSIIDKEESQPLRSIPPLRHLKHLNIDLMFMHAQDFQKIIKSAPQLTSLKIANTYNSEREELTLEPEQLKNLKQLEVSGGIRYSDLIRLLSAAPNLEQLTINNCYYEEGDFTPLPVGYLGKLTRINIFSATVRDALLANLISASPRLSRVGMDNRYRVDRSGDFHHVLNPDGRYLKHLSSVSAHLSEAQCLNILSTAPELREARFNVDFSGQEINNSVLASHALGTLTVEGNTFGRADNFSTLSMQSDALRVLRWRNVVLSADASIPDNLEHLVLDRVDVSIDTLRAVLTKSGHIIDVSLICCDRISSEDIQILEKEFPYIRFAFVASPNPVYSNRPASASQASRVLPTTSSTPVPGKAPDRMTVDGGFEQDEKKVHQGQEIFKSRNGADVHLEHYHLHAYDYCPNDQTSPFHLRQPDADNIEALKPRQIDPAQMHADFPGNSQVDFFGRKEFRNLSPNVWHQLPGLSHQDELIESGTRANHKIEYCRDKNSGYLYFRVLADNPVSLSLSFTLRSRPVFNTSVLNLSEKEAAEYLRLIGDLAFDSRGLLIDNNAFRQLQGLSKDRLIEALRQYCSFPTPFTSDFKGPGYATLNYTLKQRAGACRHRAMLFTALASSFGIKAHYVTNDLHAFTSVLSGNGERMVFDLGGAPANAQISPLKEEPDLSAAPRVSGSARTVKRAPELFELSETNRFQTWRTHRLQADDAPGLVNELSAAAGRPRRQLVVTHDRQSIEAIHSAWAGSDAHDASFFSPNLDSMSLECGKIEGGGSQRVDTPLARFLKRAGEHDRPVTWFIDWSDSKAEHISLNSIIDNEEPHVNGLRIPPNVRIVAIMDKASAENMGEEYLSRIDATSQAPYLTVPARNQEPKAEIEPDDALIVHENDWKKELLGQVYIEKNTLHIRNGKLTEAAKTGHPLSLTIHNAPWADREFRFFIDELNKTGRFFYNGEYHSLPVGFQLHFRSPLVDLSSLLVREEASSSGDTAVLNPATYASFFPRLSLGRQGVKNAPGLFQLNQGKEVWLKCSENMNPLEWFKLLSEAKKHQVRLRFQPVPGVQIPEQLRERQVPSALLRPHASIQPVEAGDIDEALDALNMPQAEVISVTQKTRFDSLFFHVRRDEYGSFYGEETDLLRMVRRGQPIVLKGQFSKTFIQKMQTLLVDPPSLTVNGRRYPVSGSITFLSDEPGSFAACVHEKRPYDPEVDLQRIPQPFQDRLRQVYRDWNIKPCHSHFEAFPFQGGQEAQQSWYQDLYKGLGLSVGRFSKPENQPSSSSRIENTQTTEPDELIAYLRDRPFVFLVSESGAGKSHFLNKRIREEVPGVRLFNEMNQIEQWAASKDELPILFIDEANISTEQYQVFENLAKGEKSIWLNGNKYDLGRHKVVFAGNPERYGGRIQASLFKRYPWYMEFKAQPLENIIAPFLTYFDQRGEMGALLMHHYEKAQQAGLVITPRNAINICQTAFVLKKQLQDTGLSDDAFMHYAIINELKSLTIDNSKTKRLVQDIKASDVWQASRDTLTNSLKALMPNLQNGGFEWTPSRIKTGLVLLTMLLIREEKIKASERPGLIDPDSDKPRFRQEHGINGFLLEGAPGLGKSRLCVAMLRAMDIEPVIIQLSKPQEAREKMLAAFHNGEVVIIDEFNSLTDEKLLNDLLSGLDPEKNPPEKPGFCVLATQNPVSLKNRSVLSAATENRFMTRILKKYSLEELKTVLKNTFQLGTEDISSLLREHKEARQYGKHHGFFPLPGTRNLFTEAKTVLDEASASDGLPDTSEPASVKPPGKR